MNDSKACQQVMDRLNEKGRKQFAGYLADCAKKVRSKAEEWKLITDQQFADATILDGIASPYY